MKAPSLSLLLTISTVCSVTMPFVADAVSVTVSPMETLNVVDQGAGNCKETTGRLRFFPEDEFGALFEARVNPDRLRAGDSCTVSYQYDLLIQIDAEPNESWVFEFALNATGSASASGLDADNPVDAGAQMDAHVEVSGVKVATLGPFGLMVSAQEGDELVSATINEHDSFLIEGSGPLQDLRLFGEGGAGMSSNPTGGGKASLSVNFASTVQCRTAGCVVPEPSTGALLSLGLGILGGPLRNRK